MSKSDPIYAAAVRLAKRNGYRNITRAQLAEELGKSEAWVTRHGGIVATIERLELDAKRLRLKPGKRSRGVTTSRQWSETLPTTIVDAAEALTREKGGFTRDEVATKAGVANGTINYYFGTLQGLRTKLAERLASK